jgi:ABC-type Fe3+/spermidine/putrescine transport system ATPase subunit
MLVLNEVTKRYEGRLLADRLSFSLAAGEIVALLGPSGCGKSTLLKMIAGLEAPDGGALSFDGVDLARVPPEARHFALMFQDFALFPHLNLCDNVAFGLIERRVPRADARARALDALDTVGLSGMSRRNVATLSGGEAQRVALARALVTAPRLLLLDEPFSSLDAHLRQSLQGEFRRRIKSLGISAILVTHDRQEAFSMADRVALLCDGRIQQCDAPARLLAAPANAWVAGFIGYANVFDDVVVPDGAFVLDPAAPAARVESVVRLAEGVRLTVTGADGRRYALSLSAREASVLPAGLAAGDGIGLGIDPHALLRLT